MIKKFFLSFMGSMAAIWLSLLLIGLLAVSAVVTIAKGLNGGWKDMVAAKVVPGTVLVVDLEGEVTERGNVPSVADALMGDMNQGVNLSETLDCIYRAAHDSRVAGLYVKCDGAAGGVASMQELGEAIKYFRSQPNKWAVAYADNYLQGEYYAVSGAGELWLNPSGSADIHGLSATTIFYTGLLEKLGVKMQVLRVGTFKSAVEPYTLKEMSQASRQQQESFMGAIWSSVRDSIGSNRSLGGSEVNKLADEFTFSMTADSLKALGVVTNVGYRLEAEQRVAELAKKEEYTDVNKLTTKQYATTFDRTDYSYLPGAGSGEKTIAVLYACGEITDTGTEGIVGNRMVDEIDRLTREQDGLAGLVLRVNSPGGSAFASEQIWYALEQFKEKTGLPVYVSMGDVAASGGYYISCGADVIYAEPTTITGSIGIFGMIPEIKGLLNNHLGITTSTVNTNRNSNFPTLVSPMTAEQTRKMQETIERGYELFTSRCAEGRHMAVDSLKAIAEGRVWAGSQALEIGLVDRMGSLRNTIAGMAQDLNLKGYTVKTYPEQKEKLWEMLLTLSDEELPDGAAGANAKAASEAAALLRRVEELKSAPRIQCRMEDMVIN